MIIAVDGPSASGKSTVATGTAAALELPYLDTGSMYRAVAWAVLERAADPTDEAACTAVATALQLTVLGPGRIAVDGRDVSTEIRQGPVNATVSAVSAHPGVRARLRALQRAFPGPEGAVLEGRDIGTVVFPDADLKVFITADPEERARRREQQAAGEGTYLARRDRLDHRTTPLEPADDAVVIDTTGRHAKDVVAEVVRLASRTRK